MNLNRSLTLTLLLAICASTSCSRDTVQPSSSSAGALTANSALNNNLPARPFERHVLNASGFHFLNEFIRPDVRSRIDEEPVGDSDGGYDPSTLGSETSGGDGQSESGEGQSEEVQPDAVSAEELNPTGSADSLKFGWAKKSFGDALKASPVSSGVIVLYADENYFDVNRLMAFVEAGRDRIAERSAIGGDRIQVVFGGYRGAPQLELWVVPNGTMPELKPEDRSKPSEPEN